MSINTYRENNLHERSFAGSVDFFLCRVTEMTKVCAKLQQQKQQQ